MAPPKARGPPRAGAAVPAPPEGSGVAEQKPGRHVYELGRLLGKGSFGAVYVAKEVQTGRAFVMKKIQMVRAARADEEAGEARGIKRSGRGCGQYDLKMAHALAKGCGAVAVTLRGDRYGDASDSELGWLARATRPDRRDAIPPSINRAPSTTRPLDNLSNRARLIGARKAEGVQSRLSGGAHSPPATATATATANAFPAPAMLRRAGMQSRVPPGDRSRAVSCCQLRACVTP